MSNQKEHIYSYGKRNLYLQYIKSRVEWATAHVAHIKKPTLNAAIQLQ